MQLAITILLLTWRCALAGDIVQIHGRVTDAHSNEPIASATLRVLGTSIGTVANSEGYYRLRLPRGTYTIVVGSLGYATDTLHLLLEETLRRDVALIPSAIVLPEIVVTSEDPAYEIVRRAIANKRRWQERLKNYTVDAFTRQVLKRDTAIVSITESLTKGYWQQGDTLREIVKQKRQTENIKAEFNFASVGSIINFYDEEIRFVGHRFVGPLADEALTSYDYKLLRTRTSAGREVYEIALLPRTRTVPLFEGTIAIAGTSYALMGADLRPNAAFILPFVKDLSLRYRQHFELFDNLYWMPVDVRIEARATIGAMMFTLPPLSFTQISVLSHYDINTTIPDSIFQKPRLTIDSAAIAVYDSALWQSENVLPLTNEEEQAYKTLDSTQTLDVQFRRGGMSIAFGAEGSDATAAAQSLDVAFNRVEGLRLGVRVEHDSLQDLLHVRSGGAYAFSEKRTRYNVGATVYTTAQRKFGFGIDVYRSLAIWEDFGYYGSLFNSFTSLLFKNDYRDYYEVEGWRLFLTYTPTTIVTTRLALVREDQRTVVQHTNYSLFSRSRLYRANPSIREGMYTTLRWDLRVGNAAVPLDLVRTNALELHAEQAFGRQGFSARRMWGMATLVLPTFSRSLLFPQTLSLRVAAGAADRGDFPQYCFALESASSGYAPFGVFKGMNVKEFGGTSFAAMFLEHNFRSVPFLALGMPFLYKHSLELILFGGAGKTWQASAPLPSDGSGIRQATHGWYGEIGVGINRIFDLLRTDFTWRLSAPRGFRFTVRATHVL
ncbi:MAG: hypothetical protein C4326_04910 [Ignavibacteria bacterium]